MSHPTSTSGPLPAPGPFAVRGVVEGFYGTPWTHAQRLDMIDFLARRGLNTFVYSPKDDPLMRHRWREPYRGAPRERLTELIAACTARGMTFVFCLSPGLTMRYSSATDREALLAKYVDVAALGVGEFGLLVDDIPTTLQHPEDVAAFDDLLQAQIELANNVAARLREVDPAAGLIVCPTEYWGTGEETSLRRLGAGLDPRIDLFWTGRAICAPSISLADAAAVARSMNRPPTYWDNYPVNDVAMTHELHLGPYLGRDRHLYRFARGVVANPMELAECSKIPLATIADYLADPEGYDPEASWHRAIEDVAGPDLAADFTIFADAVRGSCLNADDAPEVTQALGEFAFRLGLGDDAGAATGLAVTADRVGSAVERLLAVTGHPLIDEARPWLQTAAIGAAAMAALAAAVAAGAHPTQIAATAEEYLDALRASGRRVYGDALTMALSDAVGFARDTGVTEGGSGQDLSTTTPQTAVEDR